MSLQETAVNCLAIMDRNGAESPRYGLSPAEREKLLKSGAMSVRPAAPPHFYRYKRKPLAAGQHAYGAIADYAKELVRTGYTESLVDLAAPLGISPGSLAQALHNARQELGVLPKAKTASEAVRAAVAECKSTTYYHGMFSDIAAKHGANPQSVLDQLRHSGITARSLRQAQLKEAA
jgi:hypothetical protein